MPDLDKLARGLTDAQRRLILALDGVEYRDWKAISRNVNTRNKLAALGLAWFDVESPVRCYFMRRLSPLGLALKAHIERNEG